MGHRHASHQSVGARAEMPPSRPIKSADEGGRPCGACSTHAVWIPFHNTQSLWALFLKFYGTNMDTFPHSQPRIQYLFFVIISKIY